MYTSVRRYTFTAGLDRKSLDDHLARIGSTFVPPVQDIRSFQFLLSAEGEREGDRRHLRGQGRR